MNHVTAIRTILAILSILILISFQSCGQSFVLTSQAEIVSSVAPLAQTAACYFNGEVILDGSNVSAYLNSVANSDDLCVQETRRCVGGILSGSYQYTSCFPQGAKQACLFNGRQINHGEFVTGYSSSVAQPGGGCSAKKLMCNDGYLEGGSEAYAFSSCETNSQKSCQFGGLSIKSGYSVMGFRTSTASPGKQCEGQVLTCINGQLPNADQFPYRSCLTEKPKSCLFKNVQVSHLQTVVAFKKSIVPSPELCQRKSLSCVDGVLEGETSYPESHCSVQSPGACQFDGSVIEAGASIVAYKSAQVVFGQTCESTMLTCQEGLMKGDAGYLYRKCEWLPAKSLPSVVDFGAHGDGQTDDTVAFEAAAKVGGVIALKANKAYRVSRPIVFSKPTTLFGEENAKVILVGSGGFFVHSSHTTIENIRFDGRAMLETSCALVLLNDHDGWQRNIVIRNLSGQGLPCLLRDDRAPAQIAKTNTYVDVYISNLVSDEARGRQIILRSVWAFLFIQDISISMARSAGGPIFFLGPNEGSLISGVQVRGSGDGGESGIYILNSAAVFLSDSSVVNVGGDGLVFERVTYTYWRNLQLTSNRGYGYRADSVSSFLKTNVLVSGNTLGAHRHQSVSRFVDSPSGEATSFVVPEDLRSSWEASLSQVRDYAWLTDFGAKGDGVTDDSDAMQRAVASGANLYVPAGRYKLNKTVYVTKPIRILAKEGSVSFISSAQHAFHITASNVVLSGFLVEMLGRTNDIAIYLNSYARALEGIFIHGVDSLNAGYTVTNISTGENSISINLRKMRAWYPRNTSIYITKLKNSILQHVFGEYVGMPSAVNYPFMVFSEAIHNSLKEGTVLAFGTSQDHDERATSLVLSQSSDFHVNRWQGDVNNGHGLVIEKSDHIYLTDLVFTPAYGGSVPVIIDQSRFVYGKNFLFTQPASGQQCMRLINNDGIEIEGFLNLGGKPLLSVGNTNIKVPTGTF